MTPYQYRERSVETWKKNQTAFKGSFESFIIEKFATKIWRPDDNHNIFRILPPAESWLDYGHYGIRVFRHTNIGPKGASFLCHNLNDQLDALGVEGRVGGKCPICRANDKARKLGTDAGKQLSLQLYARGATVAWIVDRRHADKGPQIFIMPAKKVDQVICSLAYDPRRNKALPVDHPTQGYDVEFDWVKQGNFPQYDAIKLDREASPISEDPSLLDRYIKFINDNPVPQVLKYHSIEQMAEAMEGLDLEEEPVTEAAAPTGGPVGEESYTDTDSGHAWNASAPAPSSAPPAPTAAPAPALDKW